MSEIRRNSNKNSEEITNNLREITKLCLLKSKFKILINYKLNNSIKNRATGSPSSVDINISSSEILNNT